MSYYWGLLLQRIKSLGVVRISVSRGEGLLIGIEWICHKLLLLILLLLIGIKLRRVITIDSNKILLLLLWLGGRLCHLNISEEGVWVHILIALSFLVAEYLILEWLLDLRLWIGVKFEKVLDYLLLVNILILIDVKFLFTTLSLLCIRAALILQRWGTIESGIWDSWELVLNLLIQVIEHWIASIRWDLFVLFIPVLLALWDGPFGIDFSRILIHIFLLRLLFSRLSNSDYKS